MSNPKSKMTTKTQKHFLITDKNANKLYRNTNKFQSVKKISSSSNINISKANVESKKIKCHSKNSNHLSSTTIFIIKLIENEINKLWRLFVVLNHYEDIFKLSTDDLQEAKLEIAQLDHPDILDFEHKLTSLMKDNSISFNAKLVCFEADIAEGVYILKNAKFWVMYIDSKRHNEDLNFQDVIIVFEFALQHDCDQHLLFDYFIETIFSFEEGEIFDRKDIVVPSQFHKLYKENKELISNRLSQNKGKDWSIRDKSIFNILVNKAKLTEDDTNMVSSRDQDMKIENDNENDKKVIDVKNIKTDSNQVLGNLSDLTLNTVNNIIDGNCQPNESKNLLQYIKILNQRENSSNEHIILINNDHYVLHNDNFSNSGNFAIFKSKDTKIPKNGINIAITPLKKYNKEDKDRVLKDLEMIEKDYDEYIYTPYNCKVMAFISSNKNKAIKEQKSINNEKPSNPEFDTIVSKEIEPKK